MPLSYQGFGFTAILLMLGILIASQLARYIREHRQGNHRQNEH